jgi:hypothetical protein
MKRWLVISTIGCYLSILCFGVVSHAVNYKKTAHPAMYFIVWDMFCGWSAYEDRIHIIGEGESGKYYQLSPGPWGEFKPFGDLGRQHYDPFASHAMTIAANTLRYSKHEQIDRVYVVQEVWAKKFNLPDRLWAERYPEPKERYSYFHLRKVFDGGGQLVRSNQSWFDYQTNICVSDNPRLFRDAYKGKPFFHLNPLNRGRTDKAADVSAVATDSPNLLAERE